MKPKLHSIVSFERAGGLIPDDPSKLIRIDRGCIGSSAGIERVVEALRQDNVVLVGKLTSTEADALLLQTAAILELAERVEIQAAFASSLGHRELVSQYYMTVNRRPDYSTIPPHSEGGSFPGIQLASFFCVENTTDGGENIMFNVDQTSDVWSTLREHRVRGRVQRPLSRGEIAQARMLHRLDLPADVIREDDKTVRESDSGISGLTLVDVLARPVLTHCHILGKPVWSYWDDIERVDATSPSQFLSLLRQTGLLREPQGGLDQGNLDYYGPGTKDGGSSGLVRVWSSGAPYNKLFVRKVIHRLEPGEFMIQNNKTWTHAVANWTPQSGSRNVLAAFA